MDTLNNAKKLQAMNNYYKITQFLQNIIIDIFLIAFTCSLLFSYSYYFSFFKQLVSDTNYISSIFGPKCLFVVVNVIVLFLVGESKLVGNSNSSAMYDEYLERSRTLRALSSNFQEKIENSNLDLISLGEEKKVIENIVQDGKVIEEVTETIKEEEEEEEEYKEVEEEILREAQEEEEEIEKEIGDGEEETGLLPTEELNKRVEEFIARVNKQRWLEEARLLVCCAA